MDENQNRSVYLDNLRNILVYNVIFVHAIMMFAYPLMFFSPVVDKAASSRVYESIMLVLDSYMMPHMIFIAMLFIFPSLEKSSTTGYLKKRFLRLIVPLIVFLFCVGDIFPHMGLMRVKSVNPHYFESFLKYWGDFFSDFGIDFLMSGSSFFAMVHTWFLSFLFFITIVIVLLSKLKRTSKKLPDTIDSRNKIIGKTLLISLIFSLLFVTGVIAVASQGIVAGDFMRVGLFSVRADQGLLMLLLIVFGLYVYKKDWLTRGDIGSWKFWVFISLAFLALLALVVYFKFLPVVEPRMMVLEHNRFSGDHRAMPVLNESFKGIILGFYMLTALSSMSLLMFFLSFFKRFFNRPNKITSFCSKHSIYVYVLHLLPLILLQYTLKDIVMPSVVKVLFIILIVIPACLWLSHRLVYPYPKIAIAFFASLKLVALYGGFSFYYYALLVIILASFGGAIVECGRYLITSVFFRKPLES